MTDVERPSDDVLVMILDCRGGFHYFTDIRVTFLGVKELIVPERLTGSWWLYDEVYVKEKGFEYYVLLDNPLQEVKIVAEDVRIEELNLSV